MGLIVLNVVGAIWNLGFAVSGHASWPVIGVTVGGLNAFVAGLLIDEAVNGS